VCSRLSRPCGRSVPLLAQGKFPSDWQAHGRVRVRRSQRGGPECGFGGRARCAHRPRYPRLCCSSRPSPRTRGRANPSQSTQRDASGEEAGAALSPQLTRELIALREAALADDYAYRQVAHLTENIGPRPSGSPQAQQAAEYVAHELRELGLEVRLEEARVPHWVRGAEAAELIEFPARLPRPARRSL